MSTKLIVKLTRSRIGCNPNQRKVLDALGLHRRETVKNFPDNPAIHGMLSKVSHLIEVKNESE